MKNMARSRVELDDGRHAAIRTLVAQDRAGVEALLSRLSLDSLYLRFHSMGVRIDSATLDAVTSGRALVAELDGQLVGLASYRRSARETDAEVGIVVDDARQRHGIGTALWMELSRDARRSGVRHLLATVLRSNNAMLRLLRRTNLPFLVASSGSAVEITVDLTAAV